MLPPTIKSDSNFKQLLALGFVWLREWKCERIDNGEGMEKWGDRRDFNFPHLCLAGR